MAKKITLPLTEELAKTLKAGDEVLLTGTIYTSRDAGHKRMCESLAKGEDLPFDPTLRLCQLFHTVSIAPALAILAFVV